MADIGGQMIHRQQNNASVEMTAKERWTAALKCKPVDRLPFWPKLHTHYSYFRKAPFNSMTVTEIHRYIGSDNHCWLPAIVKESYRDVSFEEKASKDEIKRSYITKNGRLKKILRFSDESQSWHPVVFPVQNKNDLEVLTEFYKNCSADLDKDGLAQALEMEKKIGGEASTASYIGQSPLMYFIKYLAGIENAHYFLHDYQEEVEALFDAIHRLLLKKTEIMADSDPADMLYFSEDISTKLISPAQFKEYCYKHIRDYGNLLEGNDKNLVLHMGGHIKALLDSLDELPVKAFEAFTSPTVGDTRFIDGRRACEKKCFIGGTNAVLWGKNASDIIAELEADLDALPHHRGLVVTSGGNMPPMCEPETIKEVCDWLKNYKVRNN